MMLRLSCLLEPPKVGAGGPFDLGELVASGNNGGLMPNILIAEGTPALWRTEHAGFAMPSNFSLFAAAVQLHDPGIRCTLINIADGGALPSGTALSDFDGVMLPGSPLHIYDPTPAVARQIDLRGPPSPPACPSGGAAGVCSLPQWRSGDRSGGTRGDASSR